MRRDDIGLCPCPSDRARLEAAIAERNASRKVAWRAGIVLAAADGCGTRGIMRRSRTSRPTVWRRQERRRDAGVPGLRPDRTRPSRVPLLPRETRLRVIAKTVQESFLGFPGFIDVTSIRLWLRHLPTWPKHGVTAFRKSTYRGCPQEHGHHTRDGSHLAVPIQRAGLDPEALGRLIATNPQALRRAGHWGLPTFALGSEPLFGQGRLDQLEWRLRQQGVPLRP